MTKYKYISFVEDAPSNKKLTTKTWVVINNKSHDMLGMVHWHGAWRQYCFFPGFNMLFASWCLADIGDFISKQMKARRDKREKQKNV